MEFDCKIRDGNKKCCKDATRDRVGEMAHKGGGGGGG
jgi:hypothetical protein